MTRSTLRWIGRARPLTAAMMMTVVIGGCAAERGSTADPGTEPGADGGEASVAEDSGVGQESSFIDTGSGGDGSGFEQCASETAQVELLPLDMYIMLDQSGSMTGAKWTAVGQALKVFAEDPVNADLGVGLQYFPLPGQKVCDYAAYAVPEVAIAPLSTNAAALVASLTAHTPNGETPTLPALQGATSHARAWAQAHPSHTVVVVLATDGDPNICGSTVANVSQAAGLAASAAPKILTFVIGVGQSLSSLNDIAAAGDTEQAYVVDESATSTQFNQALIDIRGRAIVCEIDIPAPEQGELDFERVNVVYTSSQSQEVVLTYVDGAEQCGSTEHGWHYDNDLSPSRVILCDQACQQFKSDPGGSLSIVFGCERKIK